MLTPIEQDVLEMMKTLKSANGPTKASAIRQKIEAALASMTAKAERETIAEARKQGLWP